jgi:hypothetical protein
MMRWSPSTSCEYCSVGKNSTPLVCDVARNCPELNESVAFPGTCCETASKHSMFPDDAFSCEHNPTVFSDVHRKTPASAEHHEDECMSQEDILNDRCDTNSDPTEDESPMDQTRRKQLLACWGLVDLRIFGSVFFGFQPWTVAFFPCLGSPVFNFPFVQNRTKCFNTYRRYNIFCQQILPKFFQRPSLKSTAQKVWRAFCSLCDKGRVILCKLCRTTRTRFWFQRCHSSFIKFLDNSSNMMFRVMNQCRNDRYIITLLVGQHHLGAVDFDAICAASQDSLNSLTLIHFELAYAETHNLPPCKNLVVSLHNIGIPVHKILN